ncbi:hypothetical protein RJ639_026673 [Escallonia herrerae]|uniref:Uncharacterized protein n=1 Tax=Escallonia herrerae TaxID=1293975 RepID=A0AA88X646_9ASTE|nr:hypothetical protein RJ639_026673 [Escallonia herrerae]
MENSVRQDLIEVIKGDSEYYLPNDTDADESDQSIYLLNAVLSGTARLNVILPAATILAFTILTPILTNDGQCTAFDRWLVGVFLTLSSASCIFFSFTDSFHTATGRLYYGVATITGIRTFCGRHVKPCVPSDYRLRWADLFHASLSLIAFLTFAASHGDVLGCYNAVMPRKVTNTVPLVVGFVTSVLFVMFPSRRRGIAYPFLLG